MRPQNAGQNVLNVLAIAAALAVYVIVTGMVSALTWSLLGDGQTSSIFLMYVLPLLENALAAGVAGALLGLCLRTDRPVLFGSLLGGALVLYGWMSTTIYWGTARWQDVAWVGLDILAPALVAAATTVWLSRRRGPAPTEATA
jgi:hypothetical protein